MRARVSRLTVLIFVGLFVFPLTGSGQERSGVHLWAVVIGINDYQHKFPPLRYAVKDASDMGKLLKQYGFNVIALYNQQATRSNILRAIGRDLQDSVSSQDQVVIYFSGHGKDQEGRSKRGFLLPVDVDPKDLEVTGINMVLVKDLANALKAKHVLFLIDACFAGIAGMQERSLQLLDEINKIKFMSDTQQPSRQLITAGGADQEALELSEWQQGLFTHFLLQGLGENRLADINHDGMISAFELGFYVRDQVFREGQMQGRHQQPEIWALSSERGQFVFLPSTNNEHKRNQNQMTEVTTAPLQSPFAENSPPIASSGRKEIIENLDEFLIAQGEGDLKEGRLICKRVSEATARAALGRIIVTWVSENLQNSNRGGESKTQIRTHEVMQNLIRDSRIIDFSIDSDNGLCSSTIVMPKSSMLRKDVAP